MHVIEDIATSGVDGMSLDSKEESVNAPGNSRAIQMIWYKKVRNDIQESHWKLAGPFMASASVYVLMYSY